MKHQAKRALSCLLSLALALSLLPGLSLTALAWDGDPYADLVPTGSEETDALTAKQVTFNGKTGYVAPQYLLRITTLQVDVWRANIRQGAGTNTQAMTVVANGTKLTVTGETVKNGGTTWFPVNYNGYNGFISEKCVRVL